MKATNVYIEVEQSKECELVAKSQDVIDYPAHVELKVLDSVYLSRTFNLSKYAGSPLMRIALPDLELPVKDEVQVVIKLFIHNFEQVSLLGLQTLSLLNKKFPMASEFPVVSKHTSERIYNLKIKVAGGEQPQEEVIDQKHQLGELEHPAQPYLRKTISEKAGKIASSTEEKEGVKSVQHLVHGMALAVLKATRDVFLFSSPVRHTIKDEFNQKMLSRNYHFIHSPDTVCQKNVFLDLDHKRMIVLKANFESNLMKVYHSAMVLLPNGKYIMAGGNSKDGVVSHHGVYYFDPLMGDYTKISEIPFNLHKHELYYNKGVISIFGGIDMKDDKGGHNSESTNFASTFYSFNLATKTWSKGEKMSQKSNDRCPSIHFKGQYLVNRGTDTCEVLTPGSGGWKSLKVINKEKNTAMTMFQPSVFFVINDQIHICHKKSKEDITHYSISRINLTEKNVEVTHIVDTELTSLSGVKVIRTQEEDGLVEKAFVYDQVDLRLFVFKNGVHDVKSSPTEKVKINLIIDHALTSQTIGKSTENCTSHLVSRLDKPTPLKLQAVPTVLGENIKDDSLLAVHKGKRHCFIPIQTGNSVILGYFEEAGNQLYRANTEAVTLRAGAWNGCASPVLPIPSSCLNTVGHAALKVRSTIFIVGGLRVEDETACFTEAEVENIAPKSGVLTPSRQILSYRPSNHTWKAIDLLPEGLYNCKLSYHDNKIFIIGGHNSTGAFNKKIWYLNLETYSLVDSGLTLEMDLASSNDLQILSLGKFVLVGCKNLDKAHAISLDEKRTYGVNTKLFHSLAVYSCRSNDQLHRSFELLYTFGEHKKQLTRNIKVEEFVKLIETGDEEVNKYFEQNEGGVELPESYKFLYPSASEEHDLLALDLLDHNRNYSDYLKQPKFAILGESKNHKLSYSLFNYGQDRLQHFRPEAAIEEDKKEGQEGYHKGLMSLPYRKNSATCSLGNGLILISGGEKVDNGKLLSTNMCWSFNPTTRTFNELNKMRFPRAGHNLIKVGNFIYCFGGRIGLSNQLLSTSERYDITAGTWTQLKDMPCALAKFGICTLFNKIYIIGGVLDKGECSDRFLIYDILTDSFETDLSYCKELKLESGLHSLAVTSESFNTILVAGGIKKDGPNMRYYRFQFLEGHTKAKMTEVGIALYPHVDCQSAFVDGRFILIGGNDFNGSESFCLRGGVTAENSLLRHRMTTSVQSVTEIKNQFYVTDNFIHTNPQFRHLYLFGLDQKKEIWRYILLNQA
jgi:hypothetical protein